MLYVYRMSETPYGKTVRISGRAYERLDILRHLGFRGIGAQVELLIDTAYVAQGSPTRWQRPADDATTEEPTK